MQIQLSTVSFEAVMVAFTLKKLKKTLSVLQILLASTKNRWMSTSENVNIRIDFIATLVYAAVVLGVTATYGKMEF